MKMSVKKTMSGKCVSGADCRRWMLSKLAGKITTGDSHSATSSRTVKCLSEEGIGGTLHQCGGSEVKASLRCNSVAVHSWCGGYLGCRRRIVWTLHRDFAVCST